jgi:alkanesulfonate monooxygenase SsuD/methylene tetrahydromethanopterin reductase-like flavin-dependent oxidoreductase (luciferase family)
MDEGVEALHLLLSEPRATFKGPHYTFEDVELYPKAKQPQFPMLIGGNTERAIRRAARHDDGWLPASLSPNPDYSRSRISLMNKGNSILGLWSR